MIHVRPRISEHQVYVNQFIHIPIIPKHIVFMSELASSALSFDVFVWCPGVATND
jgi:hypothetical protein